MVNSEEEERARSCATRYSLLATRYSLFAIRYSLLRQRQHAVGLIEIDHEAVAAGHRERCPVIVVADQWLQRARRRRVVEHDVAERAERAAGRGERDVIQDQLVSAAGLRSAGEGR